MKSIYLRLLLVFSLLMSGCSSNKNAYLSCDNKILSSPQVSVLNIMNVQDKLRIFDDTPMHLMETIYDNDDLTAGKPEIIITLPGEHRLTFVHKPFNVDWKGDYIRYNTSEPIKWNISLKPGHAYIIKNRNHNYRRYQAFNNHVVWEPVLEELCPVSELDRKSWNPEITAIVNALDAYDSIQNHNSTDNQQ